MHAGKLRITGIIIQKPEDCARQIVSTSSRNLVSVLKKVNILKVEMLVLCKLQKINYRNIEIKTKNIIKLVLIKITYCATENYLIH